MYMLFFVVQFLGMSAAGGFTPCPSYEQVHGVFSKMYYNKYFGVHTEFD